MTKEKDKKQKPNKKRFTFEYISAKQLEKLFGTTRVRITNYPEINNPSIKNSNPLEEWLK